MSTELLVGLLTEKLEFLGKLLTVLMEFQGELLTGLLTILMELLEELLVDLLTSASQLSLRHRAYSIRQAEKQDRSPKWYSLVICFAPVMGHCVRKRAAGLDYLRKRVGLGVIINDREIA